VKAVALKLHFKLRAAHFLSVITYSGLQMAALITQRMSLRVAQIAIDARIMRKMQLPLTTSLKK